MKNPFTILGLMEEATEAEITERYEFLKSKYKEDRFLPGEEGNRAAEKLTELEDAYPEALKKAKSSNFGNKYGEIEQYLNNKDYDNAQRALDGIIDREAEWHYLQSKVYYYREWLTECRKQLMVAIELDSNCEKYKVALDKLDMVMGNSKSNPHNISGDDIDMARNNSENARAQERMQTGNALSNCCTVYCCTSLCCDAMRCCM